MSRHTADTLIAEALSHLDPATETVLTEAERDHAGAAFARIVATPEDETVPVEPSRPHRLRWGLLVTLGLAGAASIAIPGLLLGGSAYGSWTPTPQTLTSAESSAAATTCRGAFGLPDKGERVAVAERRGEWTYLLLAAPGTEAICLMPNDFIGHERTTGGDFFGHGDSDAPAPPTLAPDRIDENTSMEGSTDEGWFILTEGYVGSDVTGVTVHRASGPDIEASVAGNRFAAWWPSKVQSSHQPADTWSYTVHLADGSTRSTR
jgi:hypothetical protein